MQAANVVTLIYLSCCSLLFHKLLSSLKFYEMTRVKNTPIGLSSKMPIQQIIGFFFRQKSNYPRISYHQIWQKPTALLLCAAGDYFSHFVPPSSPSSPPPAWGSSGGLGWSSEQFGRRKELLCWWGWPEHPACTPAPANRGLGGMMVTLIELRL